ncbi:MAG: permease prefix domain 1-containing protein [Phycisphaerae bacterium]
MSHEDFEAYLTLLSRFLRLNTQQREEIRRELRAHLEDALEDEVAGGVGRKEALLHVLDDFGDAAELAARFSKLQRRRRWLMQGTMAAACIGFVVLALSVFSPDSTAPSAVVPSMAQAEDQAQTSQDTSEGQSIRRALATNIGEIDFEDAPLDQVLDWLNTFMKINLHVQWRQLESAGIQRDVPLSMSLRNVTAECALRLAVDEFAEADLDYAVLDNVLIISTREVLQRRTTTEVYDVREIHAAIAERADEPTASVGRRATMRAGSTPRGGGLSGGAPGPAGRRPGTAPGMMPPGGGAGGPAGVPGRVASVDLDRSCAEHAEEELITLLTNAIEPDTWVDNGGGVGYLQILNGALVVRQCEPVHAEIRRLLADLRAVTVPDRE